MTPGNVSLLLFLVTCNNYTASNNKVTLSLYGRYLAMDLDCAIRQCKFHAPSLPLASHKLLVVHGVWSQKQFDTHTAPSCSRALVMYSFSSPLYWDTVNTQLLRSPSLATSGWNNSKECLSSNLFSSIQQSYKIILKIFNEKLSYNIVIWKLFDK